MDEAVFRRIKKCLALSNSPEPGEAAAALHQAQRLMAKYNITMEMVERSQITQENVQATGISRIKRWESTLAIYVVGNSFGCRVSWINGRSGVAFGQFCFFGVKHQVEMCVYTFNVLHRQLLKSRAEFIKTLPGGLSRKEVTERGDSFCSGWISAVYRTVSEFVNPPEIAALIESVYNEHVGGRTGNVRPATKRRPEDFNAGFATGEQVALRRPVKPAEERTLLGA